MSFKIFILIFTLIHGQGQYPPGFSLNQVIPQHVHIPEPVVPHYQGQSIPSQGRVSSILKAQAGHTVPSPSQNPNTAPPFSTLEQPINSPIVVRRVTDTIVDCKKNHMVVTFKFSVPFNGYIYPYHHFPQCVMFTGQQTKETKIVLHHGACANKVISNQREQGFSAIIEHRLQIQWEKEFVCEDDSSVIVRCDRPDEFNKTIRWNVATLSETSATLERAKHPGPKMWMEIQLGEGPNAPPLNAASSIYIGDVLTLVFTLSDDVFWFDSNIITCIALDGGEEKNTVEWEAQASTNTVSNAVKLYAGEMAVIEDGCSVKPKIFSHFFKEKLSAEGNLITLLYAHFKAFRFPTSQKIVLQCNVQVCYKECPQLPSCSTAFQPRSALRNRREAPEQQHEDKDPAHEMDRIALYKTIEVLSTEENSLSKIPLASVDARKQQHLINKVMEQQCFSASAFYGWTTTLCVALIVLSFAVIYCHLKSKITKSIYTPTK